MSASSVWNSPASRIEAGPSRPCDGTLGIDMVDQSRPPDPWSAAPPGSRPPSAPGRAGPGTGRARPPGSGAATAARRLTCWVTRPFAGQARQHAAHDGPADAEALADRILGQLGSRPQRRLDDGAPQALIDGLPRDLPMLPVPIPLGPHHHSTPENLAPCLPRHSRKLLHTLSVYTITLDMDTASTNFVPAA